MLSCAGITESDVQVRVQRALGDAPGIGFTVLASLGQVSAVLADEGAGAAALGDMADPLETPLGGLDIGV